MAITDAVDAFDTAYDLFVAAPMDSFSAEVLPLIEDKLHAAFEVLDYHAAKRISDYLRRLAFLRGAIANQTPCTEEDIAHVKARIDAVLPVLDLHAQTYLRQCAWMRGDAPTKVDGAMTCLLCAVLGGYAV